MFAVEVMEASVVGAVVINVDLSVVLDVTICRTSVSAAKYEVTDSARRS